LHLEVDVTTGAIVLQNPIPLGSDGYKESFVVTLNAGVRIRSCTLAYKAIAPLTAVAISFG